MSATSVGQIGLDLKLNNNNIRKQLKDAVNSPLKDTNKLISGSLTNSFKKLGKAMIAAFAVKKVISFGKACVSAASEAESAWKGLSSVLEGQGKSFSQANAFIKDYISDGLVPLSNAVTAYKNLAARGYSTEQIEQTLTALKDAAAFGRQASYSYGEAIQSATEGLKNENSVLVDNAGVTKNVAKMWDEYAKSIGTTANNLTQQQKIQAEVNGILQETKWQAGDAAKYAQTYAGQTAKLNANFTALKTTLGQLLTNVLLPLIKGLNQMVEATNRAASAVADFFGVSNQASGGAGAVAATVGAMSDNLDGATSSANALKKSLSGIDKLNVVGSSNGSADGESISVSAGSAASGGSAEEVKKTNPLLDQMCAKAKKAITKIAELGKSFTNLSTTVAKVLGPSVLSLCDSAVRPLLKALGEAATVLTNLFNGLAKFIKEHEALVVSALGAITAGIVAFKTAATIKSVVTGFQEAQLAIKLLSMQIGSTNLAQAALNGTLSIGETIVALLTGKMTLAAVAQGIMTKAQAALNAVMAANPIGLIIAAIAALVAGFVILWKKSDAFRNFWIKMWNGIKKAVGAVVGWIKENWQSMLLFLVNPLAGVFKYCYDHFEGFRNFVDNILKKVGGFFSNLWQGIKNGASSAWNFLNNKILAPMKTAFKAYINFLISAVNLLIKGINLVNFDVPEWVPGVGGKKFGFNIPEIPKLAQGGYVKANTPQLAMIGDNRHEGEIVAPESKIVEAVMAALGPFVEVLRQLSATIKAMGGSNGQPIIVKCILDGKVVYETVVKQNNARYNQTGKSQLKV